MLAVKAVDKIKTVLPKGKSGTNTYDPRNVPVVVNPATAGRNVSTLKQNPSLESTLAAGNKRIGEKLGLGSYMDDAVTAGAIPGAGGAAGTGGAAASGIGGMFDDGILRGFRSL